MSIGISTHFKNLLTGILVIGKKTEKGLFKSFFKYKTKDNKVSTIVD
jgi:hypothetical protein